MSPKLSLAQKRGFLFFLFQQKPVVRVIARQLRDKCSLAAIFVPRHQGVSSGPLIKEEQISCLVHSNCRGKAAWTTQQQSESRGVTGFPDLEASKPLSLREKTTRKSRCGQICTPRMRCVYMGTASFLASPCLKIKDACMSQVTSLAGHGEICQPHG